MKTIFTTLLTLASVSMLFADDIVLDMDASISSQQILLGEPTVTWRYSASVTQGPASTLSLIPNSFLGPIISVNTGDSVQIHQQNNLMGETTTHFHGLDIPEISDGHPKTRSTQVNHTTTNLSFETVLVRIGTIHIQT